MKRTLLLVTLLTHTVIFSQITVANNNNVGIGTSKDYVPNTKLEVSSENNGDAILRIVSDKDNNNEADNARIELRQDGETLGVDIGFNSDKGGLEPDNLFRIRGLYSSQDKGDLLAIRLNSGNIGIGTSNPVRALHINQFTKDQGLYITEPNNSQTISLHLANNASGEYGYLNLGGNTVIRGNGQSSNLEGRLSVNLSGKTGPAGRDGFYGTVGNDSESFIFLVGREGDQKAKGFGFWNVDEQKVLGAIKIDDSYVMSNFGIGVTSPTEKLDVNGKVKAHTYIALQSGSIIPDYVFEKYYQGESKLNPDYTMPTLEEVERFTRAHNHLPEIPSYKEVQESGVDLGEMTNLLLQKIEELTLYTIEQNKLNQLQERKIQELEQKIGQIEKTY